MTIFRWIMAVLSVLLAGGAAGSFALFIAFDIDFWLQRARSLKRGLYLALLFWFNIEVWGRVVVDADPLDLTEAGASPKARRSPRAGVRRGGFLKDPETPPRPAGAIRSR